MGDDSRISVTMDRKGNDSRMSTVTERKGVLHHPVLLYISSKVSIKSSPSLKSYIVKVMRGDLPVPSTLTQFYRSYFEDQLRDFFNLLTHKQAKKVEEEHVDEVLDKLGKLAFDDVVKQKHITRKVLKKIFKNTDLNDISFLTYGMLYEDDKGKKYVFKEPLLQEYLMARYQFRLVLKKLQKGSTNKRDLYDSVYMIPNTADAWVVMFGMMSDNEATVKVQKKLLAHVIRKMKKSMIVKNKDITCFCVQVVFETKDKGDVASTLDLFTRNEAVDLVSLALPPQKVAYFLSALGFIVEKTKMYGLQIEDFQMTESSIGLLTDPANEVSDNNLQFLSLSGNPLGSAGIRRLQPFLVKASLLTWLDLSSCQLKNSGLLHFAYIIECMPLIWLNLANNEITDKGAEILSNHLRLCPTMREISLANNRITDEGAHCLAKAIEDLPEICKVILSGNEIGEDGEMFLTSAALKIALESNNDEKAETRRVKIILDEKKENLVTPEVIVNNFIRRPNPFDDISVGSLSKLPSQISLDSTGSWENKPDLTGTVRSLPPDIHEKTGSLGRRSIGGGSLARRRVIAQSLRRLQQPVVRPRLHDSLFVDPNTSGYGTTPRPSSSLSDREKSSTLPARSSSRASYDTRGKPVPVSSSPDDAVPKPKVDIQVNGVPMIMSPEETSLVVTPNKEVQAVVETQVASPEEVRDLQQSFIDKMNEEVAYTTEEFPSPTSITGDFSESVLRSINQESNAIVSDVNDRADEFVEVVKNDLDEAKNEVDAGRNEFEDAKNEFFDDVNNALGELKIVEDRGNESVDNIVYEGKNTVKHSLEEGVIDLNMNGNVVEVNSDSYERQNAN